MILEPVALLDELTLVVIIAQSGFKGCEMRGEDFGCSITLQRLLNYITPDVVHVMIRKVVFFQVVLNLLCVWSVKDT